MASLFIGMTISIFASFLLSSYMIYIHVSQIEGAGDSGK